MYILIADDETPARSELRYILEMLAPDATFHEATNGEEALSLIEREPIEVVFLDINMPDVDGLAVAATIVDGPEPPLVVFATAYDEHALQAFELAALDYVVKPFDERRLARTVERVRQALDERTTLARRQAALREYLLQAAPIEGLTKLWGKRANENRVLVDYHDILWVEAEAKKVYMQNTAGENKAYLVNLDHVAEVVPWFSGTYLVRMADEARTEIPMSRRYAKHLKKMTGWR
jgi:DNA-binding LytR/AlgR family response regulator